MSRARLVILCALAAAAAAHAEFESPLKDGGTLAGLRLAGSGDAGRPVEKVYIVQLRAPAAVEFHATRAARAMAKPGTGSAPGGALPRFDKNAAAVQGYVQQLEDVQSKVLARLGPGPRQIYSYRYALNGFAAKMTPAQALELESQPEVLHVWEDEVRPLATSYSARFLGLFDSDTGLRALGLDGDGVIIGVIDSGVAPGHPALSDKREADRPRACRSRWAEVSLLGRWLCRRYDRLEDVVMFEPPENWNGTCQSGPEFPADTCNNKLIGARYFSEGAQAGGPIDDGEIFSAHDVDGHGTHTATTAAGNRVRASIFGTALAHIEGIAPRARIAVYKACWLRPGDLRATCNTSDLANAIDAAVADGVHIINYSVGSSLLTVTAPDDIALMNAAKAGVLTVVAAGNEGPNFNTIGSPAGAPWVITPGASSRDGEHSLEAIEVTAPSGVAGRYAVQEASFTPPLEEVDPIEAQLVLVDDGDETLDDGSEGTTFDACEEIDNANEVNGNVAFIQRGGCDFEVKVANAEAAGAVAALVFNIAGDPIVMIGEPNSVDIPALMIGQADGNLLRDAIDEGQIVDVVLDKGLLLSEEDSGNVMGVFSSRGPGPVEDILKPDVTAPGINILAGFTPDAANSVQGESFAFLSGTSMSAPHVAGVAALLREAHPDWSPAALKSALMTTAYQDVTEQDGETPAHPFDFGSGHIDPNSALDPGLVYDLGAEEYDAFACGTGSPAVDEARCNELEAGFSFEAADMNQPSIALSRLTHTRTVKRRVTNVSDEAGSYVAEIQPPPGISVLVTPSALALAPGASAEFEVTLGYENGPLDLWRFGSLTWVGDEHSVRSVLAVRPTSINAPREVFARGGTGSFTFPVEFGYTGTYTPGVHGLRLPLVFPDVFIEEDPTKTFTFRETNGVRAHLIDVPADMAYLRFALFDELTDGEDDLDMYVFYCPDMVTCTKIGQSGEPTSREQFDVLLPGAGRYAVFVHAFDTDDVVGGPGAVYTFLAWGFGLNDDQGNMTATGPVFVNAGTTADVTVDWSGLASNTIYLGGISHNTPQGLVAITLVTIQN